MPDMIEDKKIIEAVIEMAADGTVDIYCIKEPFSGAGATVCEAKADMAKQIAFFRRTAREAGLRYPEFLDGEFKIQYTFDIDSILHYYVDSGKLSLSGLERITGISQKQLWSYLNGTKPRKKQKERIENGLRSFSRQLNSLFM